MKKSLLAAVLVMAEVGFATPVVSGVTAKQRYPWNGLVDITVTLSGTEEECAAATFPFYVTNKTTCAELPIGSVKAVGAVSGSGNTWTRRFIWNATADVGCAKFGEVELTVGTPSIGVQLWENGPYWAECNVGATKPEGSGYYFWWGDTIGYKRNANDNGWRSVMDLFEFSFDSANCPTTGKDDPTLQSKGCIDATYNLMAAYDAATAYLGAPWRMPTDAEWAALTSNCSVTWIVHDGVNGLLVRGRGAYALRSIFLPAVGSGIGSALRSVLESGAYWSSTRTLGYFNNYARELYFDSSKFVLGDGYRYFAQPVRPVRGFVK